MSLKERLLISSQKLVATGIDTNTVSSPSSSNIYLLDGGVSTHLRELWQKDFPYPQLWSSSLLLSEKGRSVILQGHKHWLRSGSNILTTVTYQCHSLNGVIDETQLDRMLQDGVSLARQAINEVLTEGKGGDDSSKNAPSCFVVASMGCYGAALADGSEYTGHYPNIQKEQDLVDFHRHKTRVLLEQEPDLALLGPFPDNDANIRQTTSRHTMPLPH